MAVHFVSDEPTVEVKAIELEHAGWKRYRGRPWMWESPNGGYWLGPNQAWHIMKDGLDLPMDPTDAIRKGI